MIIHRIRSSRDLKPHNILLAAKDRKGAGRGRQVAGGVYGNGAKGKSGEDGGGSEGSEGGASRTLSRMGDVAQYVLKISDMGLGKQLLNGQSRCGLVGATLCSR